MEQFNGQDILSFIKELPNDEACKAYLAKIKWQVAKNIPTNPCK